MCTHCPEIDALTRHVRSFAVMLTERQGERLPEWLVAVRQDDLPSLHTLAAGIDRDRDAVIAGLTLPWSSGAVEGHVNRIILWNSVKQRLSSGGCLGPLWGRYSGSGLFNLASARFTSAPDECAPTTWRVAAPGPELLDRDVIGQQPSDGAA